MINHSTYKQRRTEILNLALIKHANDFAEFLQGKMEEPSVSPAVAEAAKALDELFLEVLGETEIAYKKPRAETRNELKRSIRQVITGESK